MVGASQAVVGGYFVIWLEVSRLVVMFSTFKISYGYEENIFYFVPCSFLCARFDFGDLGMLDDI